MNNNKPQKIYFKKESDSFYDDLKFEVNRYFKENNISTYANKFMYSKMIVFFLIYFIAYLSIFYFGDNLKHLIFTYSFIGIWGVFLGLNVGHDAAHNAIFKKKKYNHILIHVFDLLGTNSYNWKNRHVGAHHLYPNIMNYDSDIQQTNVVKIFPKDKHQPFHFIQYLYMPFLYMIYILRWIIYRDFKDVYSSRIGGYDNSKYPLKEIIKMIFFKSLYLVSLIILPWYFLDFPLYNFLLLFLLLTVFASLCITMVLLSTHVGEDANFPEPNSNGEMPFSWSHHHLKTAGDFSTNSFIITHLFGGFNHHVIHHLFQNICHIHYPELTKILIKVSAKHGLEYRSKKYLTAAVLSHFKLLFNNRKAINSQV